MAQTVEDKVKIKELPQCGIIMPISATATHGEQHWADVQKLLHRAIGQAGFDPVNVWTSDLNDRVSERIVGNIFSHGIVIADISDLNPNVMFELGLRLSSKKPTVVIIDSGGSIPFDIRDFHAIVYPADLSMLGMENFFERLKETLVTKHAAYQKGSYVPFLGNVVVDVLSPQTRTVHLDELILSRLDDLGARIAGLEHPRESSPPSQSAVRSPKRRRVMLRMRGIDQDMVKKIEAAIDAKAPMASVILRPGPDYQNILVDAPPSVSTERLIEQAKEVILSFGVAESEITVQIDNVS